MIRNYLCRTTSQEFNPPVIGLAKLKDYTELVPVYISKITNKYAYIIIQETNESRMIMNGHKEWVKGIESTKIETYYAHIHGHSIFESKSPEEVVEHVFNTLKDHSEATVSWRVIHALDNGLGLTKHLKSDIIKSVLTTTGWTHEDVHGLSDGLERQVYKELDKARATLKEIFKTVK